tara:strand:- start:1311 stop:1643 length:333 start_codon:yes stop_codon:yes gene_type:complete
MKLTKVANIVHDVLINNEEAKDDDCILVFDVWNKLAGRNIWEVPMGDFFFILKDKWGLPNEQSIRRCRRKIQEHYPETRGSKYIKRMKRQESVKTSLNLVAAGSRNPSIG